MRLKLLEEDVLPAQLGDSARVLVVDDNDSSLRLLTRLLEREGHVVTAMRDSRLAAPAMEQLRPDVVILDVVMPEPDGFQVCRAVKENTATRLTPVVLVTALQSPADRLRGIDAGADDFLIKPFDAAELRARIRSLLRLKRYTDDLDSAESVILSLALTVEARDPYTSGHCQRLATYAALLGRRLGLSPEACNALRRGGYLHDLGKIGVPDSILFKSGALTPEECLAMQQHAVIGERLCGELRCLTEVRPIVRHHHERLDGSGYPDGLAGDQIPLAAQIMSVVDVFDALTTKRPYRSALTHGEAVAELRHEVRRGWKRSDLVESFVEVIADRRSFDEMYVRTGHDTSMFGAMAAQRSLAPKKM